MTALPVEAAWCAALQALVRIPTVSDRDPSRVDTDAFDRLLAELATQFPLLHERLELTRRRHPRAAASTGPARAPSDRSC